MTSKDFIEAEAGNGSIIPYREGLFWKVYQRSVYVAYMQSRIVKACDRVPDKFSNSV